MISKASTTILSACSPPCISLVLHLLTILVISSSAELIPMPWAEEVDCRELAALKYLNVSSISFSKTSGHAAAQDFGHMLHVYPCAVLNPASVQDIAALVKFVYLSPTNVTIAAKGAGHSIYGQAQAAQGIVIEMSSLGSGIEVVVNNGGGDSFVDASGGALWIDVVKEALKKGVAPRSFTDYLHLSVGGTLSNAGISGQAFRYGPQISNVLQLQVVTGKGEIVICSPNREEDLFFSVLGGLGQFGIITKARIRLHHVPPKVKWIRAFYSDFSTFTNDQEMLISQKKDYTFDYIEGFVLDKAQGPRGWKLESFAGKNLNVPKAIIESNASVLYCLELTINYFEQEENVEINKKMDSLLSPLRYLPSSIFIEDASNLKFLDRVHDTEKHLRKSGLWEDIPHPWMNLFIPKSRIAEFDAWVFKKKLRRGINGLILIYPLNRNKWDSRMSAVTPSEDIFYLVGLLGYPSLRSDPTTRTLINQNSEILHYCSTKAISYKQYLPHYSSKDEWKTHFGNLWPRFARRKLRYDPKAILSPGQKIFSSCRSRTCTELE